MLFIWSSIQKICPYYLHINYEGLRGHALSDTIVTDCHKCERKVLWSQQISEILKDLITN